jgi:hypothetical protein
MNVFYLDRDPEIAAQMMCDKHVVKMILESAQMLSTAHRVLDGDERANSAGMYKMTHKNHPSAIWVRTKSPNYEWLQKHMEALMTEYTYRYGKHHATERLIHCLWEFPKNISHGDGEVSDPPQCMPDYCKSDDTVSAYKTYYIVEKSDFATWKRRAKPEWFDDKKLYARTRQTVTL